MFWLLTIAVTALVILAVGRSSRTFEVDGFGSALLIAAGISAAGWILNGPLTALQAAMTTGLLGSAYPAGSVSGPQFYSLWAIDIGVGFVTNIFLLFVAALFVPGVTVRGVGGMLLAAALLCAVDLLWRSRVMSLM